MTIPDSSFMMDNGASCLPHPPEEENRIVTDLMNKSESNLKEGNLYYVISNRWFTSWQRYVGQGNGECSTDKQFSDSQQSNVVPSKMADRPGPIDNSDIVLDNNDCESNDLEVRRGLHEGADYVLVPQEAWEKLSDWYKGGPALPRKLILQGVKQHQFNVEVYPLRLNLVDSRDNSESVISLSKKASIRELYETVCAPRGIEYGKARIWDYFNKRKHTELNISNQTLEESNLQINQHVGILAMYSSYT